MTQFDSNYINTHQKRHDITIDLIQKYLDPKEMKTILDLGAKNPISETLTQLKYNVQHFSNEVNLNDNFKEANHGIDYDVLTSFEVFEHLFNPYEILRDTKAKQLFCSVPLKYWFREAYWNENDDFDKHFHEFESKQFDFMLKKAGWEIKESFKVKSYQRIPKGIRPFLQNFWPRYYFVYAERI